jgi:hypothetical protein
MDKISHYRNLLQASDTFAATIMGIAADLLGDDEFRGWDVATLILELEERTGAQLSLASRNRAMAGLVLVNSDPAIAELFYRRVSKFIQLCNALTDGVFEPRVFDPADVDEIAWGVTEAMLLAPPHEDDPNPFADEIVRYIGEACRREGLLQAPDILGLGLREDRPLEKVHENFADDPVMFEAIAGMADNKSKDIDEFIYRELDRLVQQLRSLPNTAAVQFAQQLQEALPTA